MRKSWASTVFLGIISVVQRGSTVSHSEMGKLFDNSIK